MRNTRPIPDFPRDEFYAANPLLFAMPEAEVLTLISRNANRRSPIVCLVARLAGPCRGQNVARQSGLRQA
jgi:hypothetical protein